MAGVDQPADGVMVERPQRSEDERPWGRQGLVAGWEEKGRDCLGRGLLVPGVGRGAAPSPATAGRGQPGARVPVIPSPRHGGMELFFFFQAEDGIRDLYVTGVQTCALPI